MTIIEIIQIIKSYHDGKTIECCLIDDDFWFEKNQSCFDFKNYNYRVKPEKIDFRPEEIEQKQ